MRNWWFFRYQVLTFSNLAEIRSYALAILALKKSSASDRNFGKIANSQKLVSREAPLSHR